MSSHHYQTRARTLEASTERKPQLIPLQKDIQVGSCGASSTDTQQAFLKAVGLISSDVHIESTQVLSDEEAEIISCALSHVCIEQEGLSDPYFTKEEWSKVLKTRQQHYNDAKGIIAKASQGLSLIEVSNEWLANVENEAPLCCCVAHKAEKFYGITSLLIDIAPPLNDDSGNRLAASLICYILTTAGMKHMSFEHVKAGSPSTVKYILQLPNGDTSMYTGYPDFQVVQSYSATERRLGRNILRQSRVRGVGEVHSPPGTSAKATNAAMAQAGVYTVGQFANMRSEVKRSLATILLCKDMYAHVAIATIDPLKASSAESLGEISYAVVDSMNGYCLSDSDELQRFAVVFIATLKITLYP